LTRGSTCRLSWMAGSSPAMTLRVGVRSDGIPPYWVPASTSRGSANTALTQSIAARTQEALRKSRWTIIRYSAAIFWDRRSQAFAQGRAAADVAGQYAPADTGADRFQMREPR